MDRHQKYQNPDQAEVVTRQPLQNLGEGIVLLLVVEVMCPVRGLLTGDE
jgi:hypothetical protein